MKNRRRRAEIGVARKEHSGTQLSQVLKILKNRNKTVFIDFAIPRVKCEKCQVVRQVKVRFADERRTYTRAFERYVVSGY